MVDLHELHKRIDYPIYLCMQEWSGLCAENHPPQSTTLSLQIEAKSCAWNRHTKQYEIKRGHLQHIRIEGGDAIVKGGDFLTVRVAHRFKNDRIRNKASGREISSCETN